MRQPNCSAAFQPRGEGRGCHLLVPCSRIIVPGFKQRRDPVCIPRLGRPVEGHAATKGLGADDELGNEKTYRPGVKRGRGRLKLGTLGLNATLVKKDQ